VAIAKRREDEDARQQRRKLSQHNKTTTKEALVELADLNKQNNRTLSSWQDTQKTQNKLNSAAHLAGRIAFLLACMCVGF